MRKISLYSTVTIIYIFMLMFGMTLQAKDSPYIGAGISGIVVNVDEVGDCRLSTSLIAGATLGFDEFELSVEGRKLTK